MKTFIAHQGLTLPATMQKSAMLPRTPERFIEVWQKSTSCPRAAEILGMTPHAAASRASAYRKRGWELQKFQRGKPKLDDKRFKALARSLRLKNEETRL